MKFGTLTLCAVLLASTGQSAAFSIHNPHRTAVQKALIAAQEATAAASAITNAIKSPIGMVAGGAERAYGDDYYDGMWHNFCWRGSCVHVLSSCSDSARVSFVFYRSSRSAFFSSFSISSPIPIEL
jgi:hypothetical protein